VTLPRGLQCCFCAEQVIRRVEFVPTSFAGPAVLNVPLTDVVRTLRCDQDFAATGAYRSINAHRGDGHMRTPLWCLHHLWLDRIKARWHAESNYKRSALAKLTCEDRLEKINAVIILKLPARRAVFCKSSKEPVPFHSLHFTSPEFSLGTRRPTKFCSRSHPLSHKRDLGVPDNRSASKSST
jgi:hypothetical protein